MEYRGFVISEELIKEGKIKYSGLIARKRGVYIESPLSLRLNHKAMKSTINEFINKKITL